MTLFVVDTNISREEQMALSEQIVALRPQWAICAGHDCERLHDMIDESLVNEFAPTYDVPDDRMFLTTWHAKDTVEDVLFFTFVTAASNCSGPCRQAILIIGDSDAPLRQDIDAALREFRPHLFIDEQGSKP